jgi:ABC-type bacteriocin/lantibiotic exporter with double-glycine peptidase domain
MGPTLDSLIKDLVNLKKIEKNINEKNIILQFQKSIELKNIHFSYLNSEKEALSNINLKIPYKSKIGIVGSTGSGKTTMVDLILGLLDPSKGTIFVDEKLITNKNIRSWQKNIGYVPQNIFLSDCSVLENIALGINPKNIDKNAAETAAKIANLHNFIITDLPEGYDTKVGERGIRLSGGQRQRIGIARALYNKPQLLILDESTSALDNVTEKVVMESIHNLEKNITVIMIAHRLSTVKNCDSILVIDQGKLQAKGTYNQLTDTNDIFKNLSGLNS